MIPKEYYYLDFVVEKHPFADREVSRVGAHCVGVGCDQGFWVVSSNLCLANLSFLYFPFHFVVVSCSLRARVVIWRAGWREEHWRLSGRKGSCHDHVFLYRGLY